VAIVRHRPARVIGLVLALLACAAPGARAQTIGLGARMVSVSGTDSLAVDPQANVSTKFTGGFLRLNVSKHMALEGSMDFQSETNAAGTGRIRNKPIQVSGLVIPIRTALQPYFLAGVGWYRHTLEALDNGQTVMETQSTNFGYHTGVGGQVMFGKHVSAYVDYRYTWADTKGISGLMGTVRSAVSLTSVIGALTSLNDKDASTSTSSVSRRGSMWTGGMAVYF
jgi:opacity protein-like surface antigen